jgi:hypothetical protein
MGRSEGGYETFETSNVSSIFSAARQAGEKEGRQVDLIVFSAYFTAGDNVYFKNEFKGIHTFTMLESGAYPAMVDIIKDAFERNDTEYRKAHKEKRAEAPPAKPATLPKVRVLYVDDDPKACSKLKDRIMSELDYVEVETAKGVNEARGLIDKNDFNLVISDFNIKDDGELSFIGYAGRP